MRVASSAVEDEVGIVIGVAFVQCWQFSYGVSRKP